MRILLIHIIVVLGIICCSAQLSNHLNNDSVSITKQYYSIGIDTTINKIVPIYKFKRDTIGEFLSRYCDTILTENSEFRSFSIYNLWDELNSRIKRYYPADTIINNYVYIQLDESITEQLIKNCNAVIITSNNAIGRIENVNPEWLEQLHVINTGQYACLNLTEWVDKTGPDSTMYVWMTTTPTPYETILRINKDGKVDPLTIRYCNDPIQKYPSKAHIFDWIEDYYNSYGLPSGCTFYNQTEYNDNSRPDFVIEDINGNVPYYFNLK